MSYKYYLIIKDNDVKFKIVIGLKEFRTQNNLSIEKLNKSIIFDGRNIYDKKIEEYGFELYQIGC